MTRGVMSLLKKIPHRPISISNRACRGVDTEMTSKPLSRRADSWLRNVWPSGFRDKTVFSYATPLGCATRSEGCGPNVRVRWMSAILACTEPLCGRFPAVETCLDRSSTSVGTNLQTAALRMLKSGIGEDGNGASDSLHAPRTAEHAPC